MGCSWVLRDYVYVPKDDAGWRYDYYPGGQWLKKAPPPSRADGIFENEAIRLVLHGEFSRVITWGPIWFALVPVFGVDRFWDDRYFTISFTLEAKSGSVTIDLSEMMIVINDRNVPVTDIDISFQKGEAERMVTVRAGRSEDFHIRLKSRPDHIEMMRIDWPHIKVDGSQKVIPSVLLKKRKAEWHYVQFTF